MSRPRPKVFLLHNFVTPYRLPLFEELGHQFDLTVYFCRCRQKGRRWQENLLKDYTFKYHILPAWTIGKLIINPTIFTDLLTEKFDVYLVGEDPDRIFTTLAVFFIAKLFRKPFLPWSEETEENNQARVRYSQLEVPKLLLILINKVISLYRGFIYLYTDGFIAYSQKAEQFLLSRGVKNKNIFTGVQTMPAELILPPATTKQESKYKKKLVILYLGYLRPGKGVDILIRAFRRLKSDKTLLIIVGSGPDEERLRNIAAGDKRIEFAGYVDGIERSNLYSVADVFVLPTFHDAWGLVVNEAMYFGLPIIVTKAAGASELVQNGKNGYVIMPNDVIELTDRLNHLLANSSLRKKMGKKSAEIAKTLTVEKVTEPFVMAIKFATNRETNT